MSGIIHAGRRSVIVKVERRRRRYIPTVVDLNLRYDHAALSDRRVQRSDRVGLAIRKTRGDRVRIKERRWGSNDLRLLVRTIRRTRLEPATAKIVQVHLVVMAMTADSPAQRQSESRDG